MSLFTQPGQRTKVVILVNGTEIDVGPDNVEDDDNALDSARLLANGVNSVNYPYVPGLPDLITGPTFKLRFPRAAQTQAVYRQFALLSSWRGYFDLAIFKEQVDVFTVPSGAWSPKLLRRPFEIFLDAAYWPPLIDWDPATATQAYINGTLTTITVDPTANPAYGRPPFSLGDSVTQGDVVTVYYTPLYLVRIDWSQSGASKRQFQISTNLREIRELSLTEINVA